jgi:hypothetical protein
MTKKELKQYYFLVKEIELDKKQKHKIQKELILLSRSPVTADMVQGSAHQLPFQVHSVQITGRTKKEKRTCFNLNKELQELEKLIKLKTEQKVLQLSRLSRYIQNIDDSFIRIIATMRFIDFKKWEDIAAYIGGNNTEASVRVAMNRYIEKHQQ